MFLFLDPGDTRPIPVKLCAALREQVSAGVLRPGSPVPSTRELARELGISRGSVVTAYDQLVAEGFLLAVRGSGTRIHPSVSVGKPVGATLPRATDSVALALTPGVPDTRGLVTPEWRAAWRTAAATPLTTLPPLGLPELREEVAAHLRYMRGVAADPADIIITAGSRDGLETYLRTTGPATVVGVETPGYPGLRRIPELLGNPVVEVPVDEAGTTVPSGVDALLVTPSHQYPYGGSMSAERRHELVAHSRASGMLLVEDDFDSELRYAGQPLPALASLAPGETLVLGTFSTLISPTIGCGYMVLPRERPELRAAMEKQRAALGVSVSAVTQLALAQFLGSGALRRHTGRVRRTYHRRRNVVTSLLGSLPGTKLLPINGGLHAVLLCEDDPAAVVTHCAERGVGVTHLAEYWSGTGAPPGLVLGFGHLTDDELASALSTVAECLVHPH